jgi:hypothetical protein
MISPSGCWHLGGSDRSVTPEQRLEAADAKTIDLFVPGEALNAELTVRI